MNVQREQREAGNGVIKINLKNKPKPKSQSEANKSQPLKEQSKNTAFSTHAHAHTHPPYTARVCVQTNRDTQRHTQRNEPRTLTTCTYKPYRYSTRDAHLSCYSYQ